VSGLVKGQATLSLARQFDDEPSLPNRHSSSWSEFSLCFPSLFLFSLADRSALIAIITLPRPAPSLPRELPLNSLARSLQPSYICFFQQRAIHCESTCDLVAIIIPIKRSFDARNPHAQDNVFLVNYALPSLYPLILRILEPRLSTGTGKLMLTEIGRGGKC